MNLLRLPLGVYFAVSGAVFAVVLLLVEVPVTPASAHAGAIAPGAPAQCIVVRDDEGSSLWASADTLVLTSVSSSLPDSSWYHVERDGFVEFLKGWRPIAGDSIELAAHHWPRLRFARGAEVHGIEWERTAKPILLHLLLGPNAANARPRVTPVECPAKHPRDAS